MTSSQYIQVLNWQMTSGHYLQALKWPSQMVSSQYLHVYKWHSKWLPVITYMHLNDLVKWPPVSTYKDLNDLVRWPPVSTYKQVDDLKSVLFHLAIQNPKVWQNAKITWKLFSRTSHHAYKVLQNMCFIAFLDVHILCVTFGQYGRSWSVVQSES